MYLQPLLAGVVTALVGFASAFTVVLTGLRAAGPDEQQAASGLLAVCVASGVVAVVLGLRHRMPIGIAWSTPGAALLISTGEPAGGFPAAVGAFLLCGALVVVETGQAPGHQRGAVAPDLLQPGPAQLGERDQHAAGVLRVGGPHHQALLVQRREHPAHRGRGDGLAPGQLGQAQRAVLFHGDQRGELQRRDGLASVDPDPPVQPADGQA